MTNRFVVAVAAACIAVLLSPARAAGQDGVPTAVLVHEDVAELHYLAKSLGIQYVDVTGPYMPPPTTGADVVGGALGMALVGVLAQQEAKISAQRQADGTLALLTRELGERQLQELLRVAFADALAGQGMDQRTLAYTQAARPDEALFKRLPSARGAKRFLLVSAGELAQGPLDLPLAMHDSFRQLRLSLAIEVRQGQFDRNSRVSRRDVVFYTNVMDFAEGERELDALEADGHARLRHEIGLAVAGALAMALEERDFPKVAKGEAVGALSAVGLTEFEGVLLDEKDGRALIWTRDDNYVSVPANQVIRGDALVAAREAEMTRRLPADGEGVAQAADADLDEPADASAADATHPTDPAELD